jgi:hypothetical protein
MVYVVLTPIMQFYFYIIDRKITGTKWSRELALLLHKEKTKSLRRLDPGSPQKMALAQHYLLRSNHTVNQ